MIPSNGYDIPVDEKACENFMRDQRGVGSAEQPEAASHFRLLPYHQCR